MIISRTGFFLEVRSSRAASLQWVLTFSTRKSTKSMTNFPSKVEKPRKMAHFWTYWMIRDFSQKSGSVTFLRLSNLNSMPKIRKIQWAVFSNFATRTITIYPGFTSTDVENPPPPGESLISLNHMTWTWLWIRISFTWFLVIFSYFLHRRFSRYDYFKNRAIWLAESLFGPYLET